MTSKQIGTVMLIDDNKVDQMMYQRVIDRSGLVGKTIPFFLAVDALEFLSRKETQMPDLILLDINMPRMDGFEFLEAVSAKFGTDFAPVVIMLTTSLDPNDEARAAQFDVVKSYLSKPLTEAHLQDLIDLV